jgi:2-methylfumaryl-CoA isomerase
MYPLLDDLRIVEGASFIAAPSCALHLLQMGAEVVRFDHIGGGLDYRRWPLAESGASFYWEGLNKGKKSVALDLSRPEGRELAVRLATAPGPGRGLFVTNYPVGGFLAHERLVQHREDLISVRVMGWSDGSTALDYTVNAGVGYPLMTGPPDLGDAPVNHVLPAWDLLVGSHAAMALLAAERFRQATGRGQEVRVPLGDVALATLGHLGQVAEVLAGGEDRPRLGNDLYGAWGRDFATADGRRIMVVAITARQWRGLVQALALGEAMAALEAELGVDLAPDEGVRFRHRERLNALVAAAVAARPLAELASAFEANGVCWEPYRSVSEAVREKVAAADALYAEVAHPSGHRYPTPGSSTTLTGLAREAPGRAPRLGEHTDEVLAEVLGLPEHAIARLHDAGLVAGPDAQGGPR